MLTNMYIRAMLESKRLKKEIRSFFTSEDGAVDFVAIAIILVITVTLAILFRDQLANLFKTIWGGITENEDKLGKIGITESDIKG